jgi:hypothetical protein
VNELDVLIREELDELAPQPRRPPDWDSVVVRARPPLRRRRVALALVAAVAVLLGATAVAARLGGFDDWLRGKPGKPAPESEQRGFEAANGRSWVAFPTGTELRELIRTRADERTYVLYGFRSGSSVCLRLNAVSLGKSTQACAPVSTLARISAPILIVSGDYTFFDRRARPSAEVSFGIVADGVSWVDVHAVDGRHRALVGGNAYLFVENEPNTANRVLRVAAVGPTGRRTTVPLAARLGPFATALAAQRPTGPTKVEALIKNPRIGWYLRGEKRGVSPQQVKLTAEQRKRMQLTGARLVKPDPLSDVVVGLQGSFCQIALNGSNEGTWGKGCGPGLFPRGPLNVMMSGYGGSEFMVVQGLAADGIARVTVFLADGQRQIAPLRHNTFAALVARSQFPIRIVGYDERGRVAAIETPPFSGMPVPPKARQVEPLLRVRGPNGTEAVLHVGRRVRGFHCWRVDFSTGQSPASCVPPIGGGPKIQVDVVQPAGSDLFVSGAADQVVARVQLEFEDGTTRWLRPARGHFLFAIPEDHLRPTRQFAIVRGYDRQGHRVQRQGFVFRAS